jgi:hypothetical protein
MTREKTNSTLKLNGDGAQALFILKTILVRQRTNKELVNERDGKSEPSMNEPIKT